MPTLVLERTKYDDNNTYTPSVSEQEHNARIKQNYAALIDPNKKIDEILQRHQPVAEEAAPVQDYAPVQTAYAPVAMPEPVQAPVYEQNYAPAFTPEIVTGARADSDIFRADSEVNKRLFAPVQAVADDSSEEENEDLVPTATTIQYKTLGIKKATETSSKIENKAAVSKPRFNLSKRDKIIVAVIVSVVVALFVLVIINSAVLSGLNSNVANLQSSLTTVKGAFEGVKDEISPYLNISEKDLNDFAILKGWVKIG